MSTRKNTALPLSAVFSLPLLVHSHQKFLIDCASQPCNYTSKGYRTCPEAGDLSRSGIQDCDHLGSLVHCYITSPYQRGKWEKGGTSVAKGLSALGHPLPPKGQSTPILMSPQWSSYEDRGGRAKWNPPPAGVKVRNVSIACLFRS